MAHNQADLKTLAADIIQIQALLSLDKLSHTGDNRKGLAVSYSSSNSSSAEYLLRISEWKDWK